MHIHAHDMHIYTHTHAHTNTHTRTLANKHTHRRAHLVRQSRSSYMWCDDNIRMRPQFTAGWQRFLIEHIQYGTTNPPLSDRTDTQGMDCDHRVGMSNSSLCNATISLLLTTHQCGTTNHLSLRQERQTRHSLWAQHENVLHNSLSTFSASVMSSFQAVSVIFRERPGQNNLSKGDL